VADGESDHLRPFFLNSRNEGVPSLQAAFDTVTGAYRGRDGALYFPVRTGLAVVRPERLPTNSVSPQVWLEYMGVDGQPVGIYASESPLEKKGASRLANLRRDTGTLRLGPGHRNIEFRFTAPSFTAPENVLFRYRLDGFDNDWVDANRRRNANYPRLPAGRYQFLLTACNESGIWNNPSVAVAFIVQPFVWNTWWFRISVVSLFTLGTAVVLRYAWRRRLRERLREVRQQASLDRERTRIARDMHDTLGAGLTQINFLGALASREETTPEQARTHAAKMSLTSQQLVQQLDEIVWAVDPDNDKLEDLATYISQFVGEFFADLPIRCRMRAATVLPTLRLTSNVRHNLFLAVREGLNNVARHSGASEANVALIVEGIDLVITIEDNGRGFDVETATRRHGLANLNKRLAEIGGISRIESRLGTGTKITLTWQWTSNGAG
jgi:two-component sensor histidine kinase